MFSQKHVCVLEKLPQDTKCHLWQAWVKTSFSPNYQFLVLNVDRADSLQGEVLSEAVAPGGDSAAQRLGQQR